MFGKNAFESIVGFTAYAALVITVGAVVFQTVGATIA
jgi:hypothetical protein